MADTEKPPELLPCPFCGKPPKTFGSGEFLKGLMIECVTSNCVGPHVSYYNHDSARQAWNTRADLAPTVVDARGAANEIAKYIDAVARDWYTNQDDVNEIEAIILRHVTARSGGEGER